jgi:hypothetical protein
MEQEEGEVRHRRSGSGAGAVAGGAAGLLGGLLLPVVGPIAGAIIGAAGGALAGAFLGARTSVIEWEPGRGQPFVGAHAPDDDTQGVDSAR